MPQATVRRIWNESANELDIADKPGCWHNYVGKAADSAELSERGMSLCFRHVYLLYKYRSELFHISGFQRVLDVVTVLIGGGDQYTYNGHVPPIKRVCHFLNACVKCPLYFFVLPTTRV